MENPIDSSYGVCLGASKKSCAAIYETDSHIQGKFASVDLNFRCWEPLVSNSHPSLLYI